jgi:hypothetical protein
MHTKSHEHQRTALPVPDTVDSLIASVQS